MLTPSLLLALLASSTLALNTTATNNATYTNSSTSFSISSTTISSTTSIADYIAAGLSLSSDEQESTDSSTSSILSSSASSNNVSSSIVSSTISASGNEPSGAIHSSTIAAQNHSSVTSGNEIGLAPANASTASFTRISTGIDGQYTLAQASSTNASVFPSGTAPISGGRVTSAPYSNGSLTNENSTGYGNTVTTSFTSGFSSCTTYTSNEEIKTDCYFDQTVITQTFTNSSWGVATDADQCWTEWVSYWSMHPPATASVSVITYSVPDTTATSTTVVTDGYLVTDQMTTRTLYSTGPSEVDNGGFTQTISQVVVTYTTVLSSFIVPTTTYTSYETFTSAPISMGFTLVNASYNPDWPTPSCELPATYDDCQSQWEDFAVHQAATYPTPLPTKCDYTLGGTTPACYASALSSREAWTNYVKLASSPICSQASITGALCTSLKDAFVQGNNIGLQSNLPPQRYFSNGYYSEAAPWFTGYTWPAEQVFAPGCTLGCGRCAVTGGTIQLLYFPPGLSHSATAPIQVTTMGTTLTSPTYYIAFESMYASDACSGVGDTLTSMIVPIPTDQPLSTLFGTTRPCDAHLANNPWLGKVDIGTAAFNVTDIMQDPVPYSIYSSQPYCASQIAAASACDAQACPTTLPYHPLIVLSSQLLNTLNPAWGSCSLDLRGLYDPPKALQPANQVDVPTITSAGAEVTVPATPASGPGTSTPAVTSAILDQAGTTASTNTPVAPQNSADPAGAIISLVAGTTQAAAGQNSANPGASPPVGSADPAGAIVSLVAGTTVASQAGGNGGVSPAASPAASAQSPQAQSAASANPAGPQASPATQVAANPAGGSGGNAAASQGGNNVASPSQGANVQTVGSAGQESNDPGVVVNGQTVAPAQAATVGGVAISAASNAAVIAGTTVALGSAPLTTNIGGQAVTLQAVNSDTGGSGNGGAEFSSNDPGVVLVNGQTVAPSQVATIGDVALSVASDAVVVGGSTVALGSTPLTTTIGGQVVTLQAASPSGDANAASQFAAGTDPASDAAGIIVNGQSLTGSVTTIGGVAVSAAPGAVVIGGSTVSLGSIPLTTDIGGQTVTLQVANVAAQQGSAAIVTIGNQAITATPASGPPGALVLAGTTLVPGGSAATISGTVISAGSSSLVTGGTKTISLTPMAATGSPIAVLTLGTQVITGFEATGTSHLVVIDGITLSPGGTAARIDGTLVSAASDGLVVGGSKTVSYSSIPSTVTSGGAQALVTLGGHVFTVVSGSNGVIVVNGTTLSPGGRDATIDGTEVSAGTAGLIVGHTSTIALKSGSSPPPSTGATGGSATPEATASKQSGSSRLQASARLLFGSLLVLGTSLLCCSV